MEQSIRNELPGTVKEIISDKILSEINVEIAIGEMPPVITTRPVKDMELKVDETLLSRHEVLLFFARNLSEEQTCR